MRGHRAAISGGAPPKEGPTLSESLPPPAPIRSGGETRTVRRLGAGPRLVLLHGGPGLDHHLMLPLGIPLSRHFEVWMPDLPGHGPGPAGEAGALQLPALVERTAAFLEDLDPPAEAVVGHSLGAWVLRELLRSHRIAPRAAVLLSPPVRRTGRGPAARARAGKPAGAAGAPRPLRALREDLLRFCLEDGPQRPSPLLLRAIALSWLRPPEDYATLGEQLDRALRAAPPPSRTPVPVLLLTGERDRISPPPALADLAEHTPGARVQVLPNAGHVPFAAGGDAVVGAILDFLAECGLPSGSAARGRSRSRGR